MEADDAELDAELEVAITPLVASPAARRARRAAAVEAARPRAIFERFVQKERGPTERKVKETLSLFGEEAKSQSSESRVSERESFSSSKKKQSKQAALASPLLFTHFSPFPAFSRARPRGRGARTSSPAPFDAPRWCPEEIPGLAMTSGVGSSGRGSRGRGGGSRSEEASSTTSLTTTFNASSPPLLRPLHAPGLSSLHSEASQMHMDTLLR